MSRRLTTFVLATSYLLQATWLLHAGMDLILPDVREAVAAAGDGCCASACGCPDEVKLASGCCCNASASLPQAPKSAPRTAFEELRCKGVEAAMTQAFSQPVVSAFATIPAPVESSTAVVLPDFRHSVEPVDTAIDKVPI